ncbi:class I SAM-dependent methyltransferase [Bradyrhizobium sp. WSM 1738]|uniref:class I SAM-dependent methyltransferase n=1 Tax=Bradyrhizobium hereditatis TaxID=2821405 RepID=UPI001CE2781F|nr:class I SAM-dependent methyltransferase [Bradyrhizobium hereditatis]MCA6114448.1 class I SAM-dependent methyltransferase [Bradyrhizobium hereditatis]
MRGPRAKVRDYYSGTIERHGPTPLGVDWPNAASQYLRFVQLLKLCDFKKPFSLNDFGCGYGALLDYLAMRHPQAEVAYRGTDISASMISAARQRWAGNRRATFSLGSQCGEMTDYSLASGVFNVRLGHPVADWESYVESVLRDMRASSRIGFSVNFMLPHDDQPMEDELYRSQPRRWVAFCRKELGCSVSLLKDYGLREFTLLIRRKPSTAVRRQTGSHTARRRSPR